MIEYGRFAYRYEFFVDAIGIRFGLVNNFGRKKKFDDTRIIFVSDYSSALNAINRCVFLNNWLNIC